MMPSVRILILLSLMLSSAFAFAGMDSVSDCAYRGFASLTNRNGLVAAIVSADSARVMTFGQARPDQIFEIGSVTKTFTANLLAQLVAARQLKLTDPIPAAYQKPGYTITYQNLTTHTAGIIPGNFADFHGPNPYSPYEGLTIPLFKQLYAHTPLAAPPGTKWIYSNLGEGLLGIILAEREESSYEALVGEWILKPLNLRDTYFTVPPDQLYRFAEGHVSSPGQPIQPYPHWNLQDTAVEAAGALRSSIRDMITYTRANLVPGSTPLSAAVTLSQQPLFQISTPSTWIGMNWIIDPQQQLVWHNGSTVGFQSIVAISRKNQLAIVALSDTGVLINGPNGSTMATDLQDVAFQCLK